MTRPLYFFYTLGIYKIDHLILNHDYSLNRVDAMRLEISGRDAHTALIS